jgi:hypothetical protein
MVDYTTCGKPRDISSTLTALQAQAAARCGLDAYPAETIREFELLERTIGARGDPPPHGTTARYQSKYHPCRCGQCLAAQRTYWREHRRRHR